MVRICRKRIRSFSCCSAEPGLGSGAALVGCGLWGIRSGGRAESGGRGGRVLDSGKRSGAVCGSGVGEGELSDAACGDGADSSAPGCASWAPAAGPSRPPPTQRQKDGTATNQEIRQRTSTCLCLAFLTNIWSKWSGRRDSNPRPLEPHSSALPSCATARQSRGARCVVGKAFSR